METHITNFERQMKVIDEVVAIVQRIMAREANRIGETSCIRPNIIDLQIKNI